MKIFQTCFKIWNKTKQKLDETLGKVVILSQKYSSPFSRDAFIRRALGVLKIDLFSENWALQWSELVLCHINTTQHEHDFCLFIFFQLINLDFMLSWSQYLNINMTSSSVEVGLQLFIYYQHIKWWGYFKCLENCQ